MTTLQIQVPKVSGDLVANVLSVLGLVGVVVGLGGLTGNWWVSLIVGGALLTAVCVINLRAAAPATGATAPAAVVPQREALDDVRQVRSAIAIIERKLAGAA